MPTTTGSASPLRALQRLSEWQALQAEKAQLHARESALLDEVLSEALAECAGRSGMDDLREIPIRSAIAEFSAAGRISPRTMEAAMWHAHALVSDFPLAYQGLQTAQISPTHARLIVDAGATITDPTARAAYERAAVDYACGESPNRVRSVVRMLAARHGGESAEDARKRTRDERTVWIDEYNDDDAVFHLRTSAALAHAAYNRVTQLADLAHDPNSDPAHPIWGIEIEPVTAEDDTLIDAGLVADDDGLFAGAAAPNDDPRTLAQVRADVALDLLLSARPETVSAAGVDAIHARVQITIPSAVLDGTSSAPAELDGYGPIDPALARHLAARAPGWDRLYLDPVSGAVTATDRYRPTADMRRYLRARDVHCRFPGCVASVRRCDLDHTAEHSRGGPTAVGNLAHLCRRHHALKHPDLAPENRWNAHQLPGGVIQWTSPHGRVFTDHPQPRVAFV